MKNSGVRIMRREGKTGILPDVRILLTEVERNLQGDFSRWSGGEKMARPAGLEPATHSLEGCCSIQLSYGRLSADRATEEEGVA